MSCFCAQNARVLTPVGIVCILAAGLFCFGVKDLGLNSIKRKRCTKASIKLQYSEAVVAKTIQEQFCLTDGKKMAQNAPTLWKYYGKVMLARSDRLPIPLRKLNCFVETFLLQIFLAKVSVLRWKNCRSRKRLSSEREDKKSI